MTWILLVLAALVVLAFAGLKIAAEVQSHRQRGGHPAIVTELEPQA